MSEKQILSHSQSSESILKPNAKDSAAKSTSANETLSSSNPKKPQNEIKIESNKTLTKTEIPKSLTKPAKVPVVVSKPANPTNPVNPPPSSSSLYSGIVIENKSSDDESSRCQFRSPTFHEQLMF
jgi:hypothetical protein